MVARDMIELPTPRVFSPNAALRRSRQSLVSGTMAFRRCAQLSRLALWAALGAALSGVAFPAGPDQPCPPVGDVELHAQLWPFGPDGDFWEITIRPDGTRSLVLRVFRKSAEKY